MNGNMKKKEGFRGQKAIVIPKTVINNRCAKNPVIGSLYITNMGYYPKAQYHYRQRLQGADQHILIYCHEGSGMIKLDKTEYRIEAGDFFLIPGKTKHSYGADEHNPWTIYWVHFKGTAANEIVELCKKNNNWKGFAGAGVKSLELFQEIYSQFERGYGTDTLLYANMCFWHFLGTLLFHEKAEKPHSQHNKNAVDKAIDLFSTHIDQVLTLEEIAAAANLSPAHFSTVFKKKTGFSPIEYFNHLKIQKACQYLQFTNLLIKEIAHALGIQDQYYFSRLFTRVMGISPNDYREKRNQ